MEPKALAPAEHPENVHSLLWRPVHFTIHQGSENFRVRLTDQAFQHVPWPLPFDFWKCHSWLVTVLNVSCPQSLPLPILLIHSHQDVGTILTTSQRCFCGLLTRNHHQDNSEEMTFTVSHYDDLRFKYIYLKCHLKEEIKRKWEKSERVLEGNIEYKHRVLIRGKRTLHETEKLVRTNLCHILGVKILSQSISTSHLWSICFSSMLPRAMTQNTHSIMLSPGIYQAPTCYGHFKPLIDAWELNIPWT